MKERGQQGVNRLSRVEGEEKGQKEQWLVHQN